METPQEALSRAKIQLMSKPGSVFFTTVCFSLRHLWDDRIKTACTNGKEIRFNPQFFMRLSQEERVFLLVHESMHVAYLHMDRLNEREPKKFNVAADHVINLQLIERGFYMPTGGYADPVYSGMGTEEVYALLPEDTYEDVEMDLEASKESSEDLQGQIQEIIVRAAVQVSMQDGSTNDIPGDIRIYLDRLLKPKLPWQRILQKYLNASTKHDYSFRKPNRRFFPTYLLPRMYSESLMDIAVAVDTSGSVSTENFNSFVSDISFILKHMKPAVLNLIQFDTAISTVTPIKSAKELSKVTFIGRGGTHIGDLMKWVNEHKPKLLLVFTDGEFEFYQATTKVNTVWVIHNNPRFIAPFGKVIHYTI